MHCSIAEKLSKGIHLLDGATGTQLLAAGMPKNCCHEKWILENPDKIIRLQRQYAESGSEIIYAPTFLANSLSLKRHDPEADIEKINSGLISLSRTAAPNCLIAGNLTTLRGCIDTSDAKNFSQAVSVYRNPLHALMQGGADIIAAETLLHPLEAEAILTAAKAEGAEYVMISFALRPDCTLFSGHNAESIFSHLENMGAAAIGVNCIAADRMLPPIISRLRQSVRIPIICKPNTGRVTDGKYPISIDMYTDVMHRCIENGASLVGGCCGTSPAYIAALKKIIK